MSADPSSRRRAAALAGHLGHRDEAEALVADSDPIVRATALGALERMDAVTTLQLDAALIDDAASVRRRACEIVARLPGDQAPSLLAALVDPDSSVVEVAAWACGERLPAEPGALQALVELAGAHEDALVREAAVAALGAIGHEDGLPAILSALGDKATVRRRAVIALAPFEGAEVDRAMEIARTDRDWQVRQAAEDLSET